MVKWSSETTIVSVWEIRFQLSLGSREEDVMRERRRRKRQGQREDEERSPLSYSVTGSLSPFVTCPVSVGSLVHSSTSVSPLIVTIFNSCLLSHSRPLGRTACSHITACHPHLFLHPFQHLLHSFQNPKNILAFTSNPIKASRLHFYFLHFYL